MNLLLDDVPDHITVCGQTIPIKTDFRVWIRFENMLLGDSSKEDQFKGILNVVNGLYIDTPEFIDSVLWFYQCGVIDSPYKSVGESKRVYDFEKDQYMIYTAFRQYYNIDLVKEKLHWWIFKQLFLELPDDSNIKKVMMYRSVKITSAMSPEQKKYYAEMKRIYALSDNRSKEQRAASFGSILAGGMNIKGP